MKCLPHRASSTPPLKHRRNASPVPHANRKMRSQMKRPLPDATEVIESQPVLPEGYTAAEMAAIGEMEKSQVEEIALAERPMLQVPPPPFEPGEETVAYADLPDQPELGPMTEK